MIGIPLIILTAASSRSDSIPASTKTEAREIVVEKCEYFALKTNAAAWAAGIMNVAWEMQVGTCFTIELPIWWSPYFISRNYALRTFAIQPELRYWLNTPGQGHFFGIHPGIAWYNLRFRDVRYQDSKFPLVNAGISYGYTLRLNDKLIVEFSLGAGYASTRYDRYYNIPNGAKIDTRQTSYWGIDRIELSLAYHFDF